MQRILAIFFILFLAADLFISFERYESLNLDGDMVPILLPSEHYSKILKDPLGWSVLTKGEKYAATNRYAAHKSMDVWFNSFHQFYSKFWKDKIACLYSLQGLFDVLVHIFMLFLLSIYVCRHTRFWKFDFILAATLLSPFFMTYGFGEIISLIMNSVTYAFFYSLPMCVFLLFFLPFYLSYMQVKPIKEYFNPMIMLVWTFLMLYLSFSSVILLPISIILCFLILILNWKSKLPGDNFLDLKVGSLFKAIGNMDKVIVFYMVSLILLSLYSFYIGTFNIENGEPIPLSERYLKLINGIKVQWTIKPAYLYATILLFVNYFAIIKFSPEAKKSKMLVLIKYGIVISIIYILLLPFGGYRPYRPNILRFDTLLPVNVFLVWAMIVTSYFVLLKLEVKKVLIYLPILTTILAIFYFSDKMKFDEYYCQNDRIKRLQTEIKEPILFNKDCSILGWEITNWDVHRHQVNEMLIRWKILDREKWYQYE